MKINRASEMGFCFGVRRALDLITRTVKEYGELQTLGAIVHNQQVVSDLANIGVHMAGSIDELRSKTVAITSHGAGPQVIEELKRRGLRIVDTTCPHVKKAQTIAADLAQNNYSIIIFGDAGHPEVRGIIGWSGGKAVAIGDLSEFEGMLPPCLGVLSQTTQNPEYYAAFIKKISSRVNEVRELRVFNTICEATCRRLTAATDLAKTVDIMIVVGGTNSSNTKRLAEACRELNVITYHIETGNEVQKLWFAGKNSVGVTAGASTPDKAIEDVINNLNAKLL
ncbi:MAG: 4-hydroxy-3-methylbut-2-enyl diphosphate reductase [Chloroflexi bacterium]|nr:4-hydroxy-3-methylbut-2-enyl diphosphate reductase [Chloroflexota bacterium]